MMLNDFLTPIDKENLFEGNELNPAQIGNYVHIAEGHGYDLSEFNLAIIGVGEDRASVGNAGSAKSPDAIRISEVLHAVEEMVDALHTGAGASGGVSGSRAQSMTNRLWEGLSAHVYVFLHQTRLSDVIRNQMTPCPAVPALFRVVDEE